ncbi:hypothetical protein RGUI_3434 [Rhodovulum sp. P5]|nr:hypothetical protein RGUI_3434 [Rhodovulum sp. P5]
MNDSRLRGTLTLLGKRAPKLGSSLPTEQRHQARRPQISQRLMPLRSTVPLAAKLEFFWQVFIRYDLCRQFHPGWREASSLAYRGAKEVTDRTNACVIGHLWASNVDPFPAFAAPMPKWEVGGRDCRPLRVVDLCRCREGAGRMGGNQTFAANANHECGNRCRRHSQDAAAVLHSGPPRGGSRAHSSSPRGRSTSQAQRFVDGKADPFRS